MTDRVSWSFEETQLGGSASVQLGTSCNGIAHASNCSSLGVASSRGGECRDREGREPDLGEWRCRWARVAAGRLKA